MAHILLKKWQELKNKIKSDKSSLDRDSLLKTLLEWCKEVQQIEAKEVKELYCLYLKFFENIKIPEYDFSNVWYPVTDIITFDLLAPKNLTYQRPIVIVRDVLWNLLAFRSNRDCPSCKQENLRVLTDQAGKDIYFSCDACRYTESLFGKEVVIPERLYPAKASLVEAHNIVPEPF